MSVRSGHLVIGGIMLAALGVRLGWALHQPLQLDPRLPDQNEYLSLARNLRAGRGLVFHDDRFDQDIYAYRTPGYPLFLAACGASPTIARMAQAMLDTTTVLAAFLLANRWLRRWCQNPPGPNPRGVQFVAPLLVAFNPFLIYFSGLILSETLFASLLMWGIVLIIHPKPIPSICGLLLLALSILVRPSALLLPPLLAAALPGGIWIRLKRTALSLAIIAVVLLPWVIRNHHILGKWVILTTNGGITRYDGFQPGATGASDQRFLQDPRFAAVRSMNEVARDAYFSKAAHDRLRQLVHEDTPELLKLTALKLARTWSPIPLSAEFGSRKLYVFVGLLFAIPFCALVLLGLCARNLPLWMRMLLLLPALYLSAVHALSVGSLRYRIPIEPPMAVVAAAGAAKLCGLGQKSGKSG